MRHPEQRNGEIFLGNFYLSSSKSRRDYENIGWCSKRLGRQAFTVEGELLPGHTPCFIERIEVETEIAVTNEIRKDILQRWLKNLENGE